MRPRRWLVTDGGGGDEDNLQWGFVLRAAGAEFEFLQIYLSNILRTNVANVLETKSEL